MRTSAIARQTTSVEGLQKLNELLLSALPGRAPARDQAFAEFSIDGRTITPVKQQSLSAPGWHILPDDAFTSASRFTP
jgi:hypothetical protein